jgi:hypothetical protein
VWFIPSKTEQILIEQTNKVVFLQSVLHLPPKTKSAWHKNHIGTGEMSRVIHMWKIAKKRVIQTVSEGNPPAQDTSNEY